MLRSDKGKVAARGFPDVILVKEGVMIAAELKCEDVKTMPLAQTRWLAELSCVPGVARGTVAAGGRGEHHPTTGGSDMSKRDGGQAFPLPVPERPSFPMMTVRLKSNGTMPTAA